MGNQISLCNEADLVNNDFFINIIHIVYPMEDQQ